MQLSSNVFIEIIGTVRPYIFDMVLSGADFIRFLTLVFRTFARNRLKTHHVLTHIKHIGIESSPIIVLSGLFTGLALALQGYIGFHRFGAECFIGPVVALGMLRDLGPVLTGLMVTGRAGSAMAAELGTMKISDQIDALKTLGVDPYQYLIVPRMAASVIVMPCLTLFSTACGMLGGYLFCTYVLHLNPECYLNNIRQVVQFTDFTGGLIKSCFFGLLFSGVASFYGYSTEGGARGVGQATTKSVVASSLLILIANYILSLFLFQTGLG